MTVYAAGATGNVAPISAISGPSTGFASPSAIALDPLNGTSTSESTKRSSSTLPAQMETLRR